LAFKYCFPSGPVRRKPESEPSGTKRHEPGVKFGGARRTPTSPRSPDDFWPAGDAAAGSRCDSTATSVGLGVRDASLEQAVIAAAKRPVTNMLRIQHPPSGKRKTGQSLVASDKIRPGRLHLSEQQDWLSAPDCVRRVSVKSRHSVALVGSAISAPRTEWPKNDDGIAYGAGPCTNV